MVPIEFVRDHTETIRDSLTENHFDSGDDYAHGAAEAIDVTEGHKVPKNKNDSDDGKASGRGYKMESSQEFDVSDDSDSGSEFLIWSIEQSEEENRKKRQHQEESQRESIAFYENSDVSTFEDNIDNSADKEEIRSNNTTRGRESKSGRNLH